MRRTRVPLDADARLVRSAARRVSFTISVAVSALVIAVLIAAFSIVFTQIPLADLLDPARHETVVDIEGLDIVIGGVVLGTSAIVLAGVLALLVTRRAVRPLEESLRRQRQFVADASHELRTPLAILDARIQMLQRSLTPADPHREIVAELRSDSRSIIAVVSDLLETIERPAGDALAPSGVAASIDASVSAMRVLARERDVELAVSLLPEDVMVAMSSSSLQRCLMALVDNAIKHSPEGATVSVAAVREGGHHIRIDVADEGPGIRGIAPSRVFDRFARSADAVDGGGSARTGFGIGLSLVQDTVARYGGATSVLRTSSDGTTISVRLPVHGRGPRR